MTRTGRQRGFVLAVTLWILAGITVAVAAITLWARTEVADAATERGRTEDALAMASTRETLLYLMATRDATLAGLPVDALDEEERALRMLDELAGIDRSPRGGEIALDDTAYAGIGGVRFGVQDETGLFSLAWPSPQPLDDFLAGRGVRERDVPPLRDALLDYIDADDLRRLNGAESREYEREGLPPPPNRRLLLPREVFDVLGWAALRSGDAAIDPDMLTTFYVGAVNLNTAPEGLLATWLPDCPRTCRAFTDRRDERPWTSGPEVEMVLGVQLPGDELAGYRTVAGDVFRLTLWGRSGGARRIHVRLTPFEDGGGPWSVLATYTVPRPSDEPTQDTGSDFFADLSLGPRG